MTDPRASRPVPVRRRTQALLALLATAALGFALAAFAWLGRGGDAGAATIDAAYHDNARFLEHASGRMPDARRRAAELDEMTEAMASASAASATTPGPASSRPPGADDWGALPRTRFHLPPRLVRRPASLKARELFRNTDLNPRDRPVSGDARAAFALLLGSYLHEIAAADKLASETARKELELLIEAGRATTFARERFALTGRTAGVDGWTERRRRYLLKVCKERHLDPSKTTVLDMERVTGRPVFVFEVAGGKIHSANLRELPLTRRVIDTRARLVQDLGASMLAWAGALRLPDARRRAELSQQISTHLAAWIAAMEGR